MSAPAKLEKSRLYERGCPSCGCPTVYFEMGYWWVSANRIRHCIDCGALLPRLGEPIQINVARGQLDDNRRALAERPDMAPEEFRPVIVVTRGINSGLEASHELVILSTPRVTVRYTPHVESWGKAHVYLETRAAVEPVHWVNPSNPQK